MEIHQKAKGFAAGLALLVAAPLLAGEKVQITGSTSIEIPKPNQIMENGRSSRLPDRPSGRSEYEGAAIQYSPMINSGASPEAQKKVKDALDKQKNWIFVDPYKMQFDNKTEEFYKGEKGTGLYNNHLMKTEEKSVVERFLQEKNRDRESDNSRSDSDDRRDRTSLDHKPDFLSAPLKDESDEEKAKPKLERGFALPAALEEKTSELFSDRNSFQKRLDSSPFNDGASSSRDKDRFEMTREDRDARDAELNKIYQPRLNGSTAPTVGSDPVNRAFDSAQQEATPFSVRRSDQLNFGRADSGNPSSRNSPIFSPGLGAPGSGLNSDLSARRSSFGDFGAKAPVASSPNPITAPAASSTPSFAPAPFILPRPQRKF
jgi:cell division protein FtsN